MKTIPELQMQIDSYKSLLAEVSRPFRSSQDEMLERMVSGLLFDATNQLRSLEQRTVKLHRVAEGAAVNAWPFKSERSRGRRNGLSS